MVQHTEHCAVDAAQLRCHQDFLVGTSVPLENVVRGAPCSELRCPRCSNLETWDLDLAGFQASRPGTLGLQAFQRPRCLIHHDSSQLRRHPTPRPLSAVYDADFEMLWRWNTVDCLAALCTHFLLGTFHCFRHVSSSS